MAGVELGVGWLSVLPSAKGFQAKLGAELAGPSKAAGETAGRHIEDGISGGAQRGAKAAAAALGAGIISAKVLGAMNSAKDAASGLEQAVGGTAAVFGEASAAVDEFAEGAAEVVGLSERAAREVTSKIGALLKGFGYEAGIAADKAIELTKIGADLAATFGGTTAEAVDALAAALRGETDPIERYGISLRQVQVNAKAVELGLASGVGQVDAYGKAQASLQIITEKAGGALGQFGRENETAAAQAQIAAAKQEDAAAKLGQHLLPIYAEISNSIGTLAEVFGHLPGGVQKGFLALAGIAVVAGPVASTINLYRTLIGTTQVAAAGQVTAQAQISAAATNSAASVQGLYTPAKQAGSALSKLGPAFGAAGIAATGASIGLAIWNRRLEQGQKMAEELGDTVRSKLAESQTFDEFTDKLAKTGSAIADLSVTASNSSAPWDADYRRDIKAGKEALEAERAAFLELQPVIEALGRETGDLDGATKTVLGSVDAVTTALDDGYTPAQAAAAAVTDERTRKEAAAQTTTEAFSKDTTEAAKAAEEYAEKLDDAISSLKEWFGVQTTGVEAQIAYRDSLADIVGLSDDVAAGTLLGQEKVDTFASALIDGRDDVLDYADALLRSGEDADVVVEKTNAMIGELFAAADQAGLTKDQVNFLRVEMGLMPEQVKTTFETNLGDLIGDLTHVKDLLDFNSRWGVFTWDTRPMQGRAGGGPIGAFEPTIVGEHGPEAIVVNRDAWVIPNHELAPRPTGAQMPPITVNNLGSPDEGGFAMAREHRRLQYLMAGV